MACFIKLIIVLDKNLIRDDDVLLQVVLYAPIIRRFCYPRGISVVHPLYTKGDVCLIVPNGMKKTLKSAQIPVKKIIELGTLKRKYHQFEAKRKLAGSYDFFICCQTIEKSLRMPLGKTFVLRKKYPITVRKLNAKSIVAALKKVPVYLPKGVNGVLRVGRMDQTPDEVADNIESVIDKVLRFYGKKWRDVDGLQVRTASSDISIPIYRPKEIIHQHLAIDFYRMRKEEDRLRRVEEGEKKQIIRNLKQLDKKFAMEAIRIHKAEMMLAENLRRERRRARPTRERREKLAKEIKQLNKQSD